MYRYWLSKRNDRVMPARSDIDPTEIPPRLLPGISLVDVLADDRRYIFRLAGTRCVAALGKDPTGKTALDAPLGQYSTAAFSGFDSVVASREPHLDLVPFIASSGHYETTETLILPLSEDGSTVNKILVFSASHDIRRYADAVGL